MVRFFDRDGSPFDVDGVKPPVYNAPRPLIGAAQRLNLSKGRDRIDKRPPLEWQQAAWRMFEQIGEIHFAFSLIGQVLSRVNLYTAVVVSGDDVPVPLDVWLEDMSEEGDPDTSKRMAEKANELLYDLVENTPGRGAGLMRSLGVNLSVPGEAYLAKDRQQWLILSSEELTSQGRRWRLRRSRQGSRSSEAGGDQVLDENTFVARLFQPSPRFSDEPDSSMLGVLDLCEQLVLLDQAMRAAARRAMNAGLVFIPDGLTAYSASTTGQTLADAVAETALSAVESEGAVSTVTPRVITGPAELGQYIKHIPLTQPVDEKMASAAQRLLERIMQGLDIPKEVVKGVADVKYANAIVVDDNLYRMTIEPLVLLIVDCLTSAYMRPLLFKEARTEGEKHFAEQVVIWSDTSAIVTRPDKSQAADTGYSNHVLSAEAWRRTRGFVETDAPDDDELLTRLAIEKVTIPPEMSTALIERINPEFWQAQKEVGSAEAGIPSDISQLLSGEAGPAPVEPTGPPIETEARAGGEITPGGNLPSPLR